MIDYPVEDMGTREDVQERHRLEDGMNETLGWMGLGVCDGRSIGSGTMEVCTLVVDCEVAKKVVARDLGSTELSDYSRICDEDA